MWTWAFSILFEYVLMTFPPLNIFTLSCLLCIGFEYFCWQICEVTSDLYKWKELSSRSDIKRRRNRLERRTWSPTYVVKQGRVLVWSQERRSAKRQNKTRVDNVIKHGHISYWIVKNSSKFKTRIEYGWLALLNTVMSRWSVLSIIFFYFLILFLSTQKKNSMDLTEKRTEVFWSSIFIIQKRENTWDGSRKKMSVRFTIMFFSSTYLLYLELMITDFCLNFSFNFYYIFMLDFLSRILM